jgi:hypothetical protein
MRRPSRGLLAAAVALAAVATGALGAGTADAVPAGAASKASARTQANSTACGNWTPRYSQDRWTYSDTQACLETDGASVWPVLGARECQYYWGGAWYNAKDKYPCQFSVNYTIRHEGQEVVSGVANGSTTASGRIEGRSGHCTGSGTYELDIAFTQDGPYWTNWKIESGTRTYQLEVPCGR